MERCIRCKEYQTDESDVANCGAASDGVFQEDCSPACPNYRDKGQTQIERRNFELTEFRLVEDGKKTKIVGHASVFNQLSEDLGGFREQVAPGAFAKSLRRDDIRALFNHNADFILGRNKAKTLRLKEDETGLYYEIDPPNTSYARDLLESIGRGDISQNSFGFIVESDLWENTKGKEMPVRTLTQVQLFDISPVTYPAYQGTDVSLKVRDYLSNLSKLDDKGTLEHTSELSLESLRLRLKYGYRIN